MAPVIFGHRALVVLFDRACSSWSGVSSTCLGHVGRPVVSLLTAAWNIYIWFFAGPRLTLVAHDRPPMHPPDSEDRPLESGVLVIECRNDGRTSTKSTIPGFEAATAP